MHAMRLLTHQRNDVATSSSASEIRLGMHELSMNLELKADVNMTVYHVLSDNCRFLSYTACMPEPIRSFYFNPHDVIQCYIHLLLLTFAHIIL